MQEPIKIRLENFQKKPIRLGSDSKDKEYDVGLLYFSSFFK